MNLDRWRRGLGTALSFIAFGLGGLAIGLIAAPLFNLLLRDEHRRQYFTRRMIRACFGLVIGLMRGLGVLDYRLDHIERLQRPGLLVLANHPTLIDVVFLLAHMPQADCIVKGQLASNPFTRGPIRAAGYITNSDPQAVLEAAKASLAHGNSLVLFPEGTRTTPHRAIKFRRGGANIALRTGKAITPVLLRCTPTTLTKGEPWYDIPPRKFVIHLRVLDDMPVNYDNHQPTGRLARRLTHRLSDHFNREMEQLDHE